LFLSRGYVFAIDIGGTITKLALFDLNYRIIKKATFETKKYKGKNRLIEAIVSQFYKILQAQTLHPKSIAAIGIGIPGLVDRQGIVYELTNIPGWKNVPLAKIIQRRLKIPTVVDNDANLTALGEWQLGKGRGKTNIISLTLGTGVGGGIIVGGELFHGGKFTAAEIGHIPVSSKGKKCNCGGEACLETYVGNSYLSRIAQKAIKKGRRSLLKKMARGNLRSITPLLLKQAAERGDSLSKEIWKEAGLKIGMVLAGLVNIFNPELIIVGGGVSFAGKFIFPSIRKSLQTHVMKVYRKNLKLVPGQFRKDGGLIGAAVLAKNVIRRKN